MDMRIKRGQILKDLRTQKGLKQSDLAEIMGITQQAYQRYEYGTSEPNADGFAFLADFYGVTTDYLLGREPAPNPFADLGLSAASEQEMLAQYMSFPEEVRAILMDAIVKLAESVKPEDSPPEIIEETTIGAELDRRAASEAEAEETAV